MCDVVGIGGVIRHNAGWGFKLTFDNTEDADLIRKDVAQLLVKRGFGIDLNSSYHSSNGDGSI